MSQWQRDSSVRIISVLALLDDLRFNFVNIYAPTNPSEQKGFFDTIHECFFPNSFMVMGGDFNCIESDLDNFGGNSSTCFDLKDLRAVHRLVDIWHRKHGRQTQCTWFNASKSIATRLDKFFIAHDLVDRTTYCEISPCSFSDHDSVELRFDLQNVFSHGPGIWRLNLELLEEENFCAMISELIRKRILHQEAFPSIHDWWDFLKDSVNIAAQNFGRDKQRRLNRDKVRITNALTDNKRALIEGDVSVKKRDRPT